MEGEEELQEVTSSLAAATDISMDAAVEAFLSELDGVFTLKEEQRPTLKAFLGGKGACASLLTVWQKFS